jgi:phosphoglycolate phosphatase-like HAD superfamily hydrolase
MMLLAAVLSQLLMLFSSDAFTSQTSNKFGHRGIALPMEPLVVGTGIEQVAKDYDIFLLDMWGVMHDGSRPYEGVIDTVKKLKEAGKEMIILSNSSKRQEKSLKMLAKLGFDPINDFSQVITSGDVSTDTKHMHTPSYLRYRTMYLLAQNLISPL